MEALRGSDFVNKLEDRLDLPEEQRDPRDALVANVAIQVGMGWAGSRDGWSSYFIQLLATYYWQPPYLLIATS